MLVRASSVLCASPHGRSLQSGLSMLFACRYTSYGRHFTQDQHLRVLNDFLLPHIHGGDTVVDFSCGANVWVPMLKNMCLEAGIVSMLPSLLHSAHFCRPALPLLAALQRAPVEACWLARYIGMC